MNTIRRTSITFMSSTVIRALAILVCFPAVGHGDVTANLQLLRNRCLYFAIGYAPNCSSCITIRHGLWAQSPIALSGEVDLAASGFSLAALPAAVANGLISSNAAVAIASNAAVQVRLMVTKATAASTTNDISLYGYRGVLFHYYVWDTVTGEFHCEAGVEISPINTTLLLFGLMVSANYFGGSVAQDYATARDTIDWHDWFDPTVSQFWGSYIPGTGFSGHWDWYTQEAMLICVMAAMSDPQIDAVAAWHGWTRCLQTYVSPGPNSQTFTSYATYFGDPFTVCYGQAFLDFSRLSADFDGVAWFQQAQTAYQGNVEFFRKERGYLDSLTLGFETGPNGAASGTIAKPNAQVNCSQNEPITWPEATIYTVAGGLGYYSSTPASNEVAQALSLLVDGGTLFGWHGWPNESVTATDSTHEAANPYIIGQDISLIAVAIDNYFTHRVQNLVLQDAQLRATLNHIFPPRNRSIQMVTNSQLSLRWQAVPFSTFTLQQTASLTGSWNGTTNLTASPDGFIDLIVPASASQQFYRLHAP